MTKYADNSFHALKIGFANELGAICGALGLDSHEVMDVFLADRKLNISPAYLQPGLRVRRLVPAEGPARAGARRAPGATSAVPILAHVLPSNEEHLQARVRPGRPHRQAQGRPVRPVVQAGHRRPAREPDGRAGRAAARQGLRPEDLRREREHVAADRREPRVHRAAPAAPRPAARRHASTRCSTTPTCAWSRAPTRPCSPRCRRAATGRSSTSSACPTPRTRRADKGYVGLAW